MTPLVFFALLGQFLVLSLLLTTRNAMEMLGPMTLSRLAEDLADDGKTRYSRVLQRRIFCYMTIQLATAVLVAGLGASWMVHLEVNPVWADKLYLSAFLFTVLTVFAAILGSRFLASVHPEKVLFRLLPILQLNMWLLGWMVLPFTSGLQDRLSRFRKASRQELEDDEERMEDTLRAYIDVGEREGLLEADEGEMLHGLVELGDTMAREVMTPRTEILAAPEDTLLRDLPAVLEDQIHTRIPIYRENLDNITGVAYIKDLYRRLARSGENSKTPVREMARPPLFVPETQPLATVLAEFKKAQVQIAIVVDEYGGAAGLITLEDILEEVVGDVEDRGAGDQADLSPWWVDGEDLVVRANYNVFDLMDMIHPQFSGDGPFNSVGGWVEFHMGRIPKSGETHVLDGLSLIVSKSDHRRMLEVRFLGMADRVEAG